MTPATHERPSGFLVLDKPAGVSSARALGTIKRRLPPGVKVGHSGTLDPFATGVLVVLVGRATKQCERIMALPKGYEATLRLGATTATLDPESPEEPVAAAAPPSALELNGAIGRFIGDIEQVPPAHSAVKVAGRRAYDLARSGRAIELKPRRVQVYRIDVLEFDWPMLRVTIDCGRGFYVRSFARDLGEALGTGAYLKALRRTRIGPFTAELAVLTDLDPLPLLPLDWLEQQPWAAPTGVL